MAMSCRERVLAALKQESLDRPPVAVFTTCDTIGMMKACGASWPEAHSDPQKMATLACAQADYFGLESVRAGFCLTQEAEAFGCPINMGTEKSSPMLKGHRYNYNPMKKIYDEPDDLPDMDEFLKTGRIKTTLEAMSIMQKTHGEDYVVVGGNTGPFTLTGHLLNTENLVYSVWTEPERAQKWTKAISAYSKAYGQALLDAGADVVQMSEPSASTDILAPSDFPVQSGQFVKDCLGSLKGHTILHICGDSAPIIPYMFDTGVDGISVEEKVPSEKAIEIANHRGCMVGNVGCAFPLFKGTPEDVAAAAKRSRDAGFNVISAGCGVPIGTPDDNIRALVKAIKG
ncbi:MAG: MtaA/CmuA family methyltransferase [Methanomethylophilus sp.]|nr:MtaA/CmuA family methyltransferase [Methanomethylophilus sp.]MEE3477534.1 MtaA/CmuA family methyltransferase [Methanomethylophilus sp.]